VQFHVNALGIQTDVGSPVPDYAYDSSNCSGPPLVIVGPHALMTMAWFDADRVHYALLPGRLRTFCSTSFFPADGVGVCADGFVRLPSGRCCKSAPHNTGEKNLADFADLDLSTLGLVPPFHAAIR